jgi:hypothetical protein
MSHHSKSEVQVRSGKVPVLLWGAALAGVLAAGSAFAQEDYATGGRVEKEASEFKTKGPLRDEVFGIKPQLGVMLFKPVENGVRQDIDARGMAGVSLEVNITRLATDEWRLWYGGISTGFMGSHVGQPGSGFLGGGDQTGSGNLLIIPLDLKVGYNLNEAFRVSMHGGANFIYRSVGNQFALGAQGATGDSDWTPYPNFGLDFEFGREIAFMVRPDFTITPGDEIFTGTFAVSIPLG